MNKIIISKKANTRIKNKCCTENKKRASNDGYKKTICELCGGEYLKYYSAKTKLCCSCREKKKLLKYGSAVKEQPGYPKDKGYFKSYDEIQKYYETAELVCLFCGNGFISLPSHLAAMHDISADEYKLTFGLPLSRGLVTSEFHEERSNDCKRREIGKKKEFMLKMQSIEKPKSRPMSLHLREHTSAELSKSVSKNPNSISKRKNIIKAYCSSCSMIIDRAVTEHAVIVQGCKILCSKCKRKRYLESQERYRVKKTPN